MYVDTKYLLDEVYGMGGTRRMPTGFKHELQTRWPPGAKVKAKARA